MVIRCYWCFHMIIRGKNVIEQYKDLAIERI